MIAEQAKYDGLLEVKKIVKHGEPSKNGSKETHSSWKWSVLFDWSWKSRLYVHTHLKALLIKQYHDKNVHIDVQNSFDSIIGQMYTNSYISRFQVILFVK